MVSVRTHQDHAAVGVFQAQLQDVQDIEDLVLVRRDVPDQDAHDDALAPFVKGLEPVEQPVRDLPGEDDPALGGQNLLQCDDAVCNDEAVGVLEHSIQRVRNIALVDHR